MSSFYNGRISHSFPKVENTLLSIILIDMLSLPKFEFIFLLLLLKANITRDFDRQKLCFLFICLNYSHLGLLYLVVKYLYMSMLHDS